MNEYIYSTAMVAESQADIAVDTFKTKIKISLADIRVFFETFDIDNNPCILIIYKDGEQSTIYDKFDRIDKAHEKHLASLDKSFLLYSSKSEQ